MILLGSQPNLGTPAAVSNSILGQKMQMYRFFYQKWPSIQPTLFPPTVYYILEPHYRQKTHFSKEYAIFELLRLG